MGGDCTSVWILGPEIYDWLPQIIPYTISTSENQYVSSLYQFLFNWI